MRERATKTRVDRAAIVSAEAEIEEDVEIGPLAVVGAGVKLGKGTRVLASAHIEGPSSIGEANVIHPFAVLGGAPQDRTHAGERTTLRIGDGNVFREHVTVNRGTAKDRGMTTIGGGGLFMAGVHVAHDCVVGDHVTLANGTLLGGHVVVEDHVVTGGLVAVQPKVRIGRGAFLAGGARVERDVPPFVIAAGDRARVRALNHVGLQRLGVPKSSVGALKEAFSKLFRSPTRAEGLRAMTGDLAADPFVAELLRFLARGET